MNVFSRGLRSTIPVPLAGMNYPQMILIMTKEKYLDKAGKASY